MNSTAPARILVIGCGGIAGAWLPTLSTTPLAKVIGLCDLDLQRAEARNREFACGAAVGTDPATMLAQLTPDIVVDLTIPEMHERIAVMALQAGCHVLAEKPMAADLAGAKRILAAASAAGKTHAVMQNRRYLPQMLRTRDALRSGAIGTLTELHADFYIGVHFGGFREQMRHVLLLDMAIHSVDQARFLAAGDPVAVNALSWNPAGSWYSHGASALIAVEFDNGVRLTYRGSWCNAGAHTSWECAWRIIGTGGTMRWNGADEVLIDAIEPYTQGFHATSKPTVAAPPAQALEHQAHAGCIHEMLTAIRNGTQPQTHGADNIRSLAIIHAAIASADAGGARVIVADLL